MSIENIVVNNMLTVASIGLIFMAVIFNTKLPPLFKTFDDNTEKAFAIAAFIFCDILLLFALILVANGIIGML